MRWVVGIDFVVRRHVRRVRVFSTRFVIAKCEECAIDSIPAAAASTPQSGRLSRGSSGAGAEAAHFHCLIGMIESESASAALSVRLWGRG